MTSTHAQGGAAISATLAASTYLGPVNDLLQLVLTIVGIISGMMAIRFYMKKNKNEPSQ